MPKGSILVVDGRIRNTRRAGDAAHQRRLWCHQRRNRRSWIGQAGRAALDLLLLDVSLPDRNGLDLLKEVRRRDQTLPVVLITAYGSIDMARAAFKSGALDYITKPWSNDELLAQVAQAVESRRLREENVHSSAH